MAASEPKCIVQIANMNSHNQYVISGCNQAVVKAVDYLKENGVRKIKYLDVEGPFHSIYMQKAAIGLENILSTVEIRRPHIPIIANCSADYVQDPEDIRESLVKQLYSTVKWSETIDRAVKRHKFLECGHGKIQTNLIRRGWKAEILRTLPVNIKIVSIVTVQSFRGKKPHIAFAVLEDVSYLLR